MNHFSKWDLSESASHSVSESLSQRVRSKAEFAIEEPKCVRPAPNEKVVAAPAGCPLRACQSDGSDKI